MPERFVPPHPPRGPRPVASWRGFFGERARNTVYGWSQQAFERWHFKRRILRFIVHVPLHPDAVQRVLLDNAANYVKPEVVKALTGPTIGNGLLTSDGPLWREQRRIVAASFTPAAIEGLTATFAAAAEATAATWSDGEVRDIAAEATATTMAIIADSLFSGDPRLKTKEAMAYIADALQAASEARMAAILGLPQIGWTKGMRKGRRGTRFLRETLGALVHERTKAPREDFLGTIVSELRERFEPAQAFELAVDNATTFYLAGHETTANTVTWTLFLLAGQPELQRAVAVEAQAAIGCDDLPDRLPLLRRVVEEAMRLYPPAPRFDRQAVAADELNGHRIDPGDIVSIWPWLIHRHRKLWDDSDAFDADRFLPDRRASWHRFQYIPFGGGPRVCVGARFAMAEALALLSHWLARWSFAPIAGHGVRPVGTVTLRPDGGLPLGIHKTMRA